MPGLKVTAQLLDALFNNVNTRFNTQMALAEQDNTFKQYCTFMQSNTYREEYPWISGLGNMRRWVGERQAEELAYHDWSLTNEDFEYTIKVLRNELQDERFALIRTRIDEMALVGAAHPEALVADFIDAHIAGTVTTYPAGFDGYALFSASHAWLEGYTTAQPNLRTAANAGKLDLTNGPANLKAARAQMAAFKNSAGKPMGCRGDTLIVAGNLEDDARQIVNSPVLNLAVGGTAGAQVTVERGSTNVLAQTGTKILVNRLLADNHWVLADTKHAMRGIIFQERQAVEFNELTDATGSERAFMRKEYLYGIDSRGAVGPGLWFTMIAGDGT